MKHEFLNQDLCARLSRWFATRLGARRSLSRPQPAAQWVGLTDEEIALICGECAASAHKTDDISYARAVEAKLKEKNT